MSVNLLAAIATGSLQASGDNEFHAPTIEEFFPDPILFGGTPFEINRVIMVRLISVAVLCTILVLYSRRAKLIPGRAQGSVEMLLDFSRKSIGEELLGKNAGPYQPLLASMFLGILFMNLTGIIPGLQIASTSIIGMRLSMLCWLMLRSSTQESRATGRSTSSSLNCSRREFPSPSTF